MTGFVHIVHGEACKCGGGKEVRRLMEILHAGGREVAWLDGVSVSKKPSCSIDPENSP